MHFRLLGFSLFLCGVGSGSDKPGEAVEDRLLRAQELFSLTWFFPRPRYLCRGKPKGILRAWAVFVVALVIKRLLPVEVHVRAPDSLETAI